MQSIFEILCLIGNPGKIFSGKSLLGNLICYISEAEGCRKLKCGKVGLQICQNFLLENQAKKFPT